MRTQLVAAKMPFGLGTASIRHELATANVLRVALTLDRVLATPPEQRDEADIDRCARHIVTLEKLEGGRFFQEVMFNVVSSEKERFQFGPCTIMLHNIPFEHERTYHELFMPFGNVLQHTMRRKRDEPGKTWAFVTFASLEPVRVLMDMAAADTRGEPSARFPRSPPPRARPLARIPLSCANLRSLLYPPGIRQSRMWMVSAASRAPPHTLTQARASSRSTTRRTTRSTPRKGWAAST